MQKVDILAIGAHPDDVELSVGGTIAKLIAAGKKVGILDLTLGEMGSRGNPALRTLEAQNAAQILGVTFRVQLNLGDGQIDNAVFKKNEIISVLRACRPDVVLANALNDRHIDHGNAAKLVHESCFLSGLIKWETQRDGAIQLPWRPEILLHYIQDYYQQPTLVVNIDDYFEQKKKAIMAFSSQFYNPDSTEPATPISSLEFLHYLESRVREMGRWVGATYGEGFVSSTPISVTRLYQLFGV